MIVMGILSGLKAIFTAIGALFRWKAQSDLLDAGEAKNVAKGAKAKDAKVKKVRRAVSDPDNLDRLRGKYQRD